MREPLIFELSKPGRRGYELPRLDLPEVRVSDLIPEGYLRRDPPRLPEVSEPQVVRHFVNLSTLNHHVDKGFYPLGSCTMKYNPKLNEVVSRLEGFIRLHPLQPETTVKGALRVMGELGEWLCEIAGMDAISLQPAAGAQGELAGILMVRSHHEARGDPRVRVLIPDSAHGTNPASVRMAGYETVQIPSNSKGLVDLDHLQRVIGPDVACFMLTNPNTLGLFESQVEEIAKIVHDHGALLYLDGANLNALLGITRPGDAGFDLVHFNLHKTFSTPHGGGGPGSGPIGVKEFLAPYLPVPVVVRDGEEFRFDWDRPDSIGKVQTFFGNFGVILKAYSYIRQLGAEGLRQVAEDAVLNANYLAHRLKPHYRLSHPGPHMHEFVLSGSDLKQYGVRTLDVAKRLLDFGYHAPTIYFPLIVAEALMIEPTETEPLEVLDGFVEAMIKIAEEARDNPELLKGAPCSTPVGRLDEAKASKELDVRI